MSDERGNHHLVFENDDFHVELKINGITEFGWSRVVVALMDELRYGHQAEIIFSGVPGAPVTEDALRCDARVEGERCVLLRNHHGDHHDYEAVMER